jgi:hypothetical protein
MSDLGTGRIHHQVTRHARVAVGGLHLHTRPDGHRPFWDPFLFIRRVGRTRCGRICHRPLSTLQHRITTFGLLYVVGLDKWLHPGHLVASAAQLDQVLVCCCHLVHRYEPLVRLVGQGLILKHQVRHLARLAVHDQRQAPAAGSV